MAQGYTYKVLVNILENVDHATLQEAKGMDYLQNRENLMAVLNDVRMMKERRQVNMLFRTRG